MIDKVLVPFRRHRRRRRRISSIASLYRKRKTGTSAVQKFLSAKFALRSNIKKENEKRLLRPPSHRVRRSRLGG